MRKVLARPVIDGRAVPDVDCGAKPVSAPQRAHCPRSPSKRVAERLNGADASHLAKIQKASVDRTATAARIAQVLPTCPCCICVQPPRHNESRPRLVCFRRRNTNHFSLPLVRPAFVQITSDTHSALLLGSVFFNMCTNMAATQTNGHKGTRKRSADQNERLIQRILASQRHVKRGGSSENHPEGDAMGWIHGASAWAFASEQQDMISQHRLVCFNFSPKSGRLSENIKWLTLVCS